MAWRAPRYCYLHAARDAGAAAVTPSPAADAAFPVANLVDDRAGSLFKFGSSGAGSTLILDRGAAGLSAIDRLIIPAGHNLSGTIDLDAGTDGVSFGTSLLSGVSVAAGLIDESFTSTTLQYLRLTFVSSGTWELPQLVFTFTNTTARGPVTPGFPDRLEDTSASFRKQDGSVATLSLGPSRRVFEYEYRLLETADEAVFAALWATANTTKPFYIDPAYDDEAAIWVRLVAPIARTLDTVAPQAEARKYARVLSMEEWLA